MYESGAKVQQITFDHDKICFKDIQKSFTVTYLLAMNDYFNRDSVVAIDFLVILD
jgi:hypothetical protein